MSRFIATVAVAKPEAIAVAKPEAEKAMSRKGELAAVSKVSLAQGEASVSTSLVAPSSGVANLSLELRAKNLSPAAPREAPLDLAAPTAPSQDLAGLAAPNLVLEKSALSAALRSQEQISISAEENLSARLMRQAMKTLPPWWQRNIPPLTSELASCAETEPVKLRSSTVVVAQGITAASASSAVPGIAATTASSEGNTPSAFLGPETQVLLDKGKVIAPPSQAPGSTARNIAYEANWDEENLSSKLMRQAAQSLPPSWQRQLSILSFEPVGVTDIAKPKGQISATSCARARVTGIDRSSVITGASTYSACTDDACTNGSRTDNACSKGASINGTRSEEKRAPTSAISRSLTVGASGEITGHGGEIGSARKSAGAGVGRSYLKAQPPEFHAHLPMPSRDLASPYNMAIRIPRR